jgi:ligand-binding sensor domain-containing protein
MAVGTDQGVAVFDGDSCLWSVLPLPQQIASSEVRDLAFDGNGNLWIATPKGLGFAYGSKCEVMGVGEGLPTVDTERLQVTGHEVFVGCFGGFIARAVVPDIGKTSFTPVNYQAGRREDTLKIRSVGISGLAMLSSSEGWFSTKGAGLVKLQGVTNTAVEKETGLASDWVETFWVFEPSQGQEHILAVTSGGLSLLKNGRVDGEAVFPREGAWLTSMVTFKIEQIHLRPKATPAEKQLFEFLDGRTLWVGTKSDGLWRFRSGLWTQYLPETSQLPSRAINRLYRVGGRLVACTDAGLVIVPLNADSYDEFKNIGLGSRSAKTIYPFPASHQVMAEIRQLVRGSDMWVSSEKGLSRFVGASGLFPGMMENKPSQKGQREVAGSEENDDPRGDRGAPATRVMERAWHFFSREILAELPSTYSLYSNNMTSIALDDGGRLWVIFDKKHLARLTMLQLPHKPDEAHERKEKPVWEFFKDSLPWPGDTELTAVWKNDGQVYVGTKTCGYYLLKNPGLTNPRDEPPDWVQYGDLEGLHNLNVIGFARKATSTVAELALLHPEGLTVYNGQAYTPVDLGGGRKYSCIAGDAAGNLWLGSDGGVIRLTPDGRLLSYSSANAHFESDRITAIAVSPDSEKTGLAVWIGCDREKNGSDQPPTVITEGTRKIVKEADIDGASLHFFDGLHWDKWKVAGVRCLYMEGDYLWVGSNIRLRRLFVPYSQFD